MKKLLNLFVLSLMFTGTIAQNNVDTLTAAQIVGKVIEFTGGEEYLKSVKTLYSEMEVLQNSQTMTWVTKEMLPNKGVFQVIVKNKLVFETRFNGKKGYEWRNGTRTAVPKKDLEDKFARNNIFNEFDYLDKNLYTLEKLTDEVVKLRDCYKLRATSKIGMVRILYISKDTFETVREDHYSLEAPTKGTTSYFSHFKNFGKLRFYSKMESGEGEDAMIFTMTKLVVNDLIQESDFEK